MKAKELIACLDDIEYEAVRVAVAAAGVDRWLMLCDLLRNDIVEQRISDKRVLCEQLYGENYTGNEGQALRNDLRKINSQIRACIIEHCRQRNGPTADEDYMLWLEWIQSKQRPALFKKEYLLLQREKERKAEYKALAELAELYQRHLKSNTEISVRQGRVMKEVIESAMHYRRLEAAEHLLELDVALHRNDATIKAFIPDHVSAGACETGLDQSTISAEVVLRYLRLRAQSYSLKGSEKILKLKELIELHEGAAKLRPHHEADIYALLGTVAIEYFLQNEFEAANEYYEIIFERYRKKQIKPRLDIVFNYASNLFKGGQFESVIRLILKNYRSIKGDARIRYRMEFFLVLSYLRLGETEQAYKELHINIHRRPSSEFLNFQFCYIIYYYQTGDFDSFERSVLNLAKHLRRHPPYEEEYVYALRLCRRMVHFSQLRSRQRKVAMLELRSEIARQEDAMPSLRHFSIYSCLKAVLGEEGYG